MLVRSYLLDSLRLFISGKYTVSDSDLLLLSDIIVDNGLEKIVSDGSVIELLHIMDRNNLSFPISYDFMKQEWNRGVTVSFNTVLRTLIDLGLITIKKLTSSTFFNSNIMTGYLTDYDAEYHLVIYATDKYKKFISDVKNSVSMELSSERELNESVVLQSMDKKFKDFAERLKKNVGITGTVLGVESFSDDVVTNTFELNLIFTLSRIGVSTSDVSKAFKTIKRNKFVKDVESYLDGTTTVFFSLCVDRRLLKQDLTQLISLVSQAVTDIQSL